MLLGGKNQEEQLVRTTLTFGFKFSYELGSHCHGNIGQETGQELLAQGHPVVVGSHEEVGNICEEVQEAAHSRCHVGCREREAIQITLQTHQSLVQVPVVIGSLDPIQVLPVRNYRQPATSYYDEMLQDSTLLWVSSPLLQTFYPAASLRLHTCRNPRFLPQLPFLPGLPRQWMTSLSLIHSSDAH